MSPAKAKFRLRFCTSWFSDLCRAVHPDFKDESDEAGKRYWNELIEHKHYAGDDMDDDVFTGVDFETMTDLWEFLGRVFRSGLTAHQLQPGLFVDVEGEGCRCILSMETAHGNRGDIYAETSLDKDQVNATVKKQVSIAMSALSKIERL